jgi:dissimilatory sulfite reductase (desulfoviridin) alpha/beta subunit
MSLAWRGYQVVTNAAREGARVALLPTADSDQVEARVRQSIEAGGLAWDEVRLFTECDGVPNTVCAEGATGTEALVRVELDYVFRLLQPLARLACWGECDDATFGLVTIASTSTMRNE